MNGGPIVLTPFGSLLTGLGIVYWVVAAWALYVALRKPTTRRGKWTALLVVIVGFGFLPGLASWQTLQARHRLNAAMSHFEMRCKTAGERINRKIADVEGVFLMRPRLTPINFSDQYALDDPYGYAGTGDDYIRLFLRGRPNKPLSIGEKASSRDLVRYGFVELEVGEPRRIYRYTTPMGKFESEFITRNGGGTIPVERREVAARQARYGITWEDISTKEDRDTWVAGSLLRIVDLQTNEVIAERIGYMIDRGLGDMSGGRSPWTFARDTACPRLDERAFYFFDRVLVPKREETK